MFELVERFNGCWTLNCWTLEVLVLSCDSRLDSRQPFSVFRVPAAHTVKYTKRQLMHKQQCMCFADLQSLEKKISMIPMRMPLGGLEVLGSALNSLTKRWFSSMFAHRFAISEERWRDQWSMVDQWYSFQWFPMRMPCGQLFWFWLRSSNCEEDVSCDHVTRASD